MKVCNKYTSHSLTLWKLSWPNHQMLVSQCKQYTMLRASWETSKTQVLINLDIIPYHLRQRHYCSFKTVTQIFVNSEHWSFNNTILSTLSYFYENEEAYSCSQPDRKWLMMVDRVPATNALLHLIPKFDHLDWIMR